MRYVRIAIIDADLLYRKKHRFPNLASMKLSSYYKQKQNTVELIQPIDSKDKKELKQLHEDRITYLESFDKVFLSKVFTDTDVEPEIMQLPNLEYGGTGFFYDKAPPLDEEIEHSKPDYNLYQDWVQKKLDGGDQKSQYKYYQDYSIGFLTRGCFRKCEFCVNKRYDRAFINSTLNEFMDDSKKKLCLLDDNFFAHPEWRDMLVALKKTKKPFQFKQGLDERLLTDEKCEMLFSSKYDGDYIFAFDNIADAPLIENKLALIRKYSNASAKFYVFCGFDRGNQWDEAFWSSDIDDVFKRIQILMKYSALSYIMRFNRYEKSPHRGIYVTLARWCNQPNFYKKKSFREFCYASGGASIRYIEEFEKQYPEIANRWFDMKFENEKLQLKIGA